MDWFKNMNMGAVAIIVGTITAVGWIVWGGTLALVISIVGGGLIALRATLGADES